MVWSQTVDRFVPGHWIECLGPGTAGRCGAHRDAPFGAPPRRSTLSASAARGSTEATRPRPRPRAPTIPARPGEAARPSLTRTCKVRPTCACAPYGTCCVCAAQVSEIWQSSSLAVDWQHLVPGGGAPSEPILFQTDLADPCKGVFNSER